MQCVSIVVHRLTGLDLALRTHSRTRSRDPRSPLGHLSLALKHAMRRCRARQPGRGARDGAKNMRDELKRQKQEEAAAIRDRRAGYAEARQALLTHQQLAVREAVNNNIAATFVPAESTRRMIQHPHYQELTAVIVDPTSAVSREIAASPKRTRRPISGGTAAALTMSGQDSKRDTRRV